eukprot:PhF_6_TR36291/c0_g1_i2/m.52935
MSTTPVFTAVLNSGDTEDFVGITNLQRHNSTSSMNMAQLLDQPLPITQKEAFQILLTIGSAAQIWFEISRKSQKWMYGALLIQHTLSLTVGQHDFYDSLRMKSSHLTFSNDMQTLQALGANIVDLWITARQEQFPTDYRGTLIPALIELSRKMVCYEFVEPGSLGGGGMQSLDSKMSAFSTSSAVLSPHALFSPAEGLGRSRIICTFALFIGLVINVLLMELQLHHAFQAIGYSIMMLPCLMLMWYPKLTQTKPQLLLPQSSPESTKKRHRKVEFTDTADDGSVVPLAPPQNLCASLLNIQIYGTGSEYDDGFKSCEDVASTNAISTNMMNNNNKSAIFRARSASTWTFDQRPVLLGQTRADSKWSSDELLVGSDAVGHTKLRWEINNIPLPSQILSEHMFIFATRQGTGVVSYWSASCETATGFPSSKALGTPLLAMLSESSRQTFKAAFLDVAAASLPMNNSSRTVVFLSDKSLTATVLVTHIGTIVPAMGTTSTNNVQVYSSGNSANTEIDINGLPTNSNPSNSTSTGSSGTGSVVGIAGELFFIGQVYASKEDLSATQSAYVEHMWSISQSEIHTLEKEALVPSNIEAPTSRVSTARMSLSFQELRRLMFRMRAQYIKNTPLMWSATFRRFLIRGALGDIIDGCNMMARRSKIRLILKVNEDFPEDDITWDEKKLRVLIEGYLSMLMSMCSNQQINIIAKRSIYGCLEIALQSNLPVENAVVAFLIQSRFVSCFSSQTVFDGQQALTTSVKRSELSTEEVMKTISQHALIVPHVINHEELGGRVRLHIDGAIVVELPNVSVENALDRAVGDVPNVTQSTQSDDTRTYRSLTFVLLEPNPVYRMQLRHYLWEKGHSVHTCSDSAAFLDSLEEHAWVYPILDIDSFQHESTREYLKEFCERREWNYAVTSVTQDSSTPTSSLQQFVLFVQKPFSESTLLSIQDHAMKGFEHQKANQEKVQHFKQLFIEHRHGQWTKIRSLGKGRFGEVILAKNDLTGGLMAVKMITIDTESPEIQQKTEDLINEIDILRTMDHPNIIHYFYCERAEDTVNIFMEYCPDGCLQDRLATSPFTHTQMSRYIKTMLSAVAYLHSIGIAHRDIKCANVLLSHGVAKLADFGTAKKIEDGVLRGTVGTPRFMAPEVYSQSEYTEVCDVWSIGCALLEMLTNGGAPFVDVCPGNKYQFLSFLAEPGEHLREDGSVNHGLKDLPHDIESFLTSCLQYDPAVRSTASTLLTHPFVVRGERENETSCASLPRDEFTI